MSSFRRRLMSAGKKKEYIKFEDPEVERICIANWSSDGVGLTYEDAERVTSIGTVFKNNTTIISFNEFLYFTNVLTISSNAFEKCSNLASITLPETLNTIGANAFVDCTSLVSINLVDSINRIDGYAFRNVPSEFIIDLPNLKTLGSGVFYNTGTLEVRNLGSVSTIGGPDGNDINATFMNCKKLKKVVLGSSITTLRKKTFNGCTALIDFTWDNNSIKSIGSRSFFDCPCEFEIDLPNLETLEPGSFFRSNITKIIDLGNVTELNKNVDGNYVNGTFPECKKLTYVRLKNITTYIGNNAFYGCVLLETFICEAVTPPTLSASSFSKTNPDMLIYVPDESVEAYKAAENWSTWASKIKPLSEYVES